MKTGIKVINEDLYSKTVIDIDTTGLYCNDYPHWNCRGDLAIEIEGEPHWRTISGEFGQNDYLEEYGFIFVMIED